MRKWQQLCFVFLVGFGIFTRVEQRSEVVRAASLSDLPYGSVIQIQPIDTYMCNDDQNCSTTTTNVLPFKFVKMQARKTDTSATPIGDQTGYEMNGQKYTYWMFLDNYCWWGNSDCRYFDGTRQSRYASWNAEGNTAGTYSNNITEAKTYNILQTLGNFYNSLPNEIGGVSKSQVIPDFNWDMYGVSTDNPPAAGWAGGTWTNITLTYASVPFQFTGANSNPIMNSKIGLVSFHEWQGANTVYSSNPTSNDGSGGSYCLARFGAVSCAASSGGMFDDTNTAMSCSVPNCNLTASAANPRPRYPWTRLPHSTNATSVWNLLGDSSYSLSGSNASNGVGVSPTLWLSADLDLAAPHSGEGSYEKPYCLDGDNSCFENTTPTSLTFLTNHNLPVRANSTATIMGQITDTDMGEHGQEITVRATINGVEKIATTSAGLDRRWALTWEVGTELGNQNWGGDGSSSNSGGAGPIVFTATDGISTITADWTWEIIVEQDPLESGFYLTNAYQNQLAIDNTIIQLIGKITDNTSSASISATIGGISKSYTVKAGSNNEGWVLTWKGEELANGKYGGLDSPIMISTTGSNATLAATYSGIITVGPPELSSNVEELINTIKEMISVRFAGTIYFPQGTSPNSSPQSQGFSFSSFANNNPNYQIWTKEITDATTNTTASYPYLIRFFTPTDTSSDFITADSVVVR